MCDYSPARAGAGPRPPWPPTRNGSAPSCSTRSAPPRAGLPEVQGLPGLHLQRLRQPADRRGRPHRRPQLPGRDQGVPALGGGSRHRRRLRDGAHRAARDHREAAPARARAAGRRPPRPLRGVDGTVDFWRRTWDAIRLEERYVPLDGLDLYQIAPGVSGELLRPHLESGGDIRMHVSNGAMASFVDTLPLLHPYGRLLNHDLFVTDTHQYRTGFLRPGQVRRLGRQLGQRAAPRARRAPHGLRRELRAVPPPRGDEHRDHDRPGAGLTMAANGDRPAEGFRTFRRPWSAPTPCRSGWSGSRPTTTSAGSAGSTSARSTTWPSRRRSRTRSWPASTSSRTASCAATTTSTTSWPASPASRCMNTAKAYYYDYYDTAVSTRLPGAEGVALGLAEDFAFTRAHTDPADQVLLHRAVLALPPGPQRGLHSTTDLVLALAEVLNTEARRLAAAGATLLQIDEPFLAGYPEQVGTGHRGDQHRHRGRRRHLGPARLLRQPLRPPVVGGPLRLPLPGRPRRQRRPARPRVRPQGLRRPPADPQVRLGPRSRPRRDRRQVRGHRDQPSWSPPGSGARSTSCRPSA